MKKFLFLFILSLVFGAAKAQMTLTTNGSLNDFVNTSAVYTDNGNSWETTYTDPLGTTYDFNWSLSSSLMLSYTCTVTAPLGHDLNPHLHDVYFYDESTSTTLMEDDFEGDGMGGYDFGLNIWQSSGSFDVSTQGTSGYIAVHLDAETYDDSSSTWYGLTIDGTLEYPL